MRTDFPLLKNHPDLIYLDSAATALKPSCVLEAEQRYGTHFGTNAARGLYPLAEETSAHVEKTRAVVARFINVAPEEIIFTQSTTGSINMLAYALESSLLDTLGEIVVSTDAHHSQILPWQELAKRKSWNIKTAPAQSNGMIDSQTLIDLVSEHTKVVTLTLVSNVFGVINDLVSIIKALRVKNPEVFIVIDAAQAVAHIPIDGVVLGADALVFSGHKIYGPTGIGICFLASHWQEKLNPSQFGGGMVRDTGTTPPLWKTGPEKFEAGTLPLAQIFGLKSALEYVTSIGFPTLQNHERELVTYATHQLITAFGKKITLLGTQEQEQKIGLLSFTLDGAHPHDIASLLGEKKICVRAGEHCASFLHRELHISASTRISFGLYITKNDIDIFVTALKEIYILLQK